MDSVPSDALPAKNEANSSFPLIWMGECIEDEWGVSFVFSKLESDMNISCTEKKNSKHNIEIFWDFTFQFRITWFYETTLISTIEKYPFLIWI